jgi:hypothetical protein
MRPHGRPKGSYTAVRSTEVAAVSTHGRPKGSYTAVRSMEIAR